MPLEERYVSGKRGRVLDVSQSNTQRIAHCSFETFAGLCFGPRGLLRVDQIHGIVDEHACSGKVVARRSCAVISYEGGRTDLWASQRHHV